MGFTNFYTVQLFMVLGHRVFIQGIFVLIGDVLFAGS